MPTPTSALLPLLQAAARTRRRFAVAVVAGVLGAATLAGQLRDTPAGWQAPPGEAGRDLGPGSAALRLDAALRLLREQHFAEAYGRLAALADEGHGDAALMALALVRHGAALNGQAWSATPGQLRRWSTLALQDLRENTGPIAQHERGE